MALHYTISCKKKLNRHTVCVKKKQFFLFHFQCFFRHINVPRQRERREKHKQSGWWEGEKRDKEKTREEGNKLDKEKRREGHTNHTSVPTNLYELSCLNARLIPCTILVCTSFCQFSSVNTQQTQNEGGQYGNFSTKQGICHKMLCSEGLWRLIVITD